MDVLACGHNGGVNTRCDYCMEDRRIHSVGKKYICGDCCRIRARVYAEILEGASEHALLKPHLPVLREALQLVRGDV